MVILVLNCGSSSIKYQVIDMEAASSKLLAKGIVERIGLPEGDLTHKPVGKEPFELHRPIPDHTTGIKLVLDALTDPAHGVIGSLDEVKAVGHRVAHGGEFFPESCIVTEEVKSKIRSLFEIAPLHNPANLEGVLSIEKVLPGVPQVTVFDTSFHMTMPEVAYTYALPKDVCDKYHVRKYGAHGTSHRYEWMMAKEILGSRCHRLLSCHLGNGASLAAIEDGVCRDTTMGLTPLDGLMMGTRCGSIDPATVCYLQREGGYSYQEVDDMMNKQSGLLAISGISNDARDIRTRASEGDERCLLAFDMFAYKAMQQAGSMIASMAGVDTITFTAGIGENDWSIRKAFCDCFEWLGVRIDNNKNREAVGNGPQVISAAGSAVTVMVIPTDEEYMIAQDTETLAKSVIHSH